MSLPTYGSLMILNARAEKGAASSGVPLQLLDPLDVQPAVGGTSSGLGRKSTTASSMGWTPLFLKADPHSTGTTMFSMVP